MVHWGQSLIILVHQQDTEALAGEIDYVTKANWGMQHFVSYRTPSLIVELRSLRDGPSYDRKSETSL